MYLYVTIPQLGEHLSFSLRSNSFPIFCFKKLVNNSCASFFGFSFETMLKIHSHLSGSERFKENESVSHIEWQQVVKKMFAIAFAFSVNVSLYFFNFMELPWLCHCIRIDNEYREWRCSRHVFYLCSSSRWKVRREFKESQADVARRGRHVARRKLFHIETFLLKLCYHPPTKLRECNVFTHVCVWLSTGENRDLLVWTTPKAYRNRHRQSDFIFG